MLPRQGGHSSALAGEWIPFTGVDLAAFWWPHILVREEPSTHLDLADFFPLPCSDHSFQRCCSAIITSSRRVSASKQYPPSPGSSLQGWKVATPYSSSLGGQAGRQVEEHSYSQHPTSSAHQKPQAGMRYVGIISERRVLSGALLCLLNAAPGDLVSA